MSYSPEMESEIGKLPEEIRPQVRELMQKLGPAADALKIAAIPLSGMSAGDRMALEHLMHHGKKPEGSGLVPDSSSRTEKPIRTVKMSPKVKAQFLKDMAWAEKAQAEFKKHEQALREIEAQKDIVKERIWALVNVEMGLSSTHYAMTLNEKTLEVEIDRKLTDEPETAAAPKSRSKKR